MLLKNYYTVLLQYLKQRQKTRKIKVEKIVTKNNATIGWLMEGWVIRFQSNRPVLCINFNACSRIYIFTDSGKSLLPYNNSCNKNSFVPSYPFGIFFWAMDPIKRFSRGGGDNWQQLVLGYSIRWCKSYLSFWFILPVESEKTPGVWMATASWICKQRYFAIFDSIAKMFNYF